VNKKEIKGSHVLIIGSGSTLLDYDKEIKYFIKNNDVITFGCNNMHHILTPDYHFWTDKSRYKKFGKNMSKKSIAVFSSVFNKKLISKHWNRKYLNFTYKNRKPKDIYTLPKIKYKNKIMYGRFRTVGSISIFYAYIKKASKISVVGMDGYTLYSEKDLEDKNNRQHCYGEKGYTDLSKKEINQKLQKNKEKIKSFYEFERTKDIQIYKCLKALSEYGINFEILTPTVYKKFYNYEIFKKMIINKEKE